MKKLLPIICILLVFPLAACGIIPGFGHISKDKLMTLDDDEFYDEVMIHIFNTVSDVNDASINEEQKTLYVLVSLEMEVSNGGLVQFFSNSSGECAPYVSDALEKAGAVDIKALYEKVIDKYDIDVWDLSPFKTEDLDEFSALYEKYDFDFFDNACFMNGGLRKYIIDYVKDNIDSIIP